MNSELKSLTKIWYKKLKDTGFKDIEYKKVLRDGIDWRLHSNGNEDFIRKCKESSEYFRVLEINAYNNKEIPLKMRRTLIKYLDTLGNIKEYREFMKSLPKRMYFRNYLSWNKSKLIDFAKKFGEQGE